MKHRDILIGVAIGAVICSSVQFITLNLLDYSESTADRQSVLIKVKEVGDFVGRRENFSGKDNDAALELVHFCELRAYDARFLGYEPMQIVINRSDLTPSAVSCLANYKDEDIEFEAVSTANPLNEIRL